MGAIAGVLGFVPTPEDLQKAEHSMSLRAPGGCEVISSQNVLLLHGRKENQEPDVFCRRMTRNGETYDLTFSGCIGNLSQILGALYAVGCRPEHQDPASVLICAFSQWGPGCLSMLRGGFSFAIWEHKGRRLFLARDQLGVRPLFYHVAGEKLIFASEIPTVLAFPGVTPRLNREGAMELVMLGPGRLPGSGVFENIRELKPGCWAVFQEGRLYTERYWQLRDQEHTDSLEDTVEHIRFLVERAALRQIKLRENLGTFLSGGLDSSILTGILAGKRGEIQTFSVDYVNNERYFTPGAFEPDSDTAYIQKMADAFHCRHKKIVLTPGDLADRLEQATLARGLPGMGDVDASLLAFCQKVSRQIPAVLSGECADEIFGGYPWFRDPEAREKEGFPWARNTQLRQALLGDRFPDGEDFSMDAYLTACRESDILPEASPEDRRIKELTYLNIHFFMQTLLDRNDRMSAAAGLEVLVPFCDVDIAEYAYRVPWSFKNLGGREKGLLREAVRGLIPEEVRMRKKSPYPKTFDPAYEMLAAQKLTEILQEDAMIWQVVSKDQVEKVLEEGCTVPWYGQLMRRPQFMAWILQLDFWLKYNKPELLF